MKSSEELKKLKKSEKQLEDNYDEKIMSKISSSLYTRNKYGNHNLNENILTTIQTNEINIENSTVIGTKVVEADNDDERYLKAIKQKNEVAILKGENILIEIIKIKTLKKILKLIGTTLKNYYYDISFGIYSCEEIVELRKTLDINSNLNDKNVGKDKNNYNLYMKPDKQLEKITLSNDIIFEAVQKEINKSNELKGKSDLKKETIQDKKSKKISEKESIFKDKNVQIKGEICKKEIKNEKIKIKEKKLKNGFILEVQKEKLKKKIKAKKKDEKSDELANKKIKQKKGILKKKNNQNISSYMEKSCNNIINKKRNLLTPNKVKNKKTNKMRNVSSILKNKKNEPLYNHTELSFNNCRKRILNKSLSNIKNKKDMNLRTLKSNKYNTKNKKENLNIKEFYQNNKDRYYNQFWKKEENNNKNIKEIKSNNNDIESIRENIKCIKCGIIQELNKNKGIYKCEKCRGFICGNCSKFHYLKNPEHKCYYLNINDGIMFDKIKRTTNILNNKSKINKSSDLNEKSEPNKSHNKLHINNKNKEIIFSKKCKICNSLFKLDNDYIILSNCQNCKGNICINCSEEHLKNYPEHNIIKIKNILINQNSSYNNQLLSKLTCNKCQKQKNDKDILYFCDKCGINICEECENEHNIKNPEHFLYLIKKIFIMDENTIIQKENLLCWQCETNLVNDCLSFRRCYQCNINLCIPCSNSHSEKYNNHNILYAIIKDNVFNNQIHSENNNKIIPKHIYKSNSAKKDIINKDLKINNNINSKTNKLFSSIKKEKNKNEKIYDDSSIDSNKIKCFNCNSQINSINQNNFRFCYLCQSCINNSYKIQIISIQ